MILCELKSFFDFAVMVGFLILLLLDGFWFWYGRNGRKGFWFCWEWSFLDCSLNYFLVNIMFLILFGEKILLIVGPFLVSLWIKFYCWRKRSLYCCEWRALEFSLNYSFFFLLNRWFLIFLRKKIFLIGHPLLISHWMEFHCGSKCWNLTI